MTDVDPAAAPSPPEEPVPDAPIYRVMSCESVVFDLADVSPQVHLMEAESPYRGLSIPIALPEAVALHQALTHEVGRRPGIHELAATLLARLRADLIAARIVRYEGGVFYAELDLMTPQGHEVVDARTSDAIILALRQGVVSPIMCAETVLAQFYS